MGRRTPSVARAALLSVATVGLGACGGPLTAFSWSVELTAPINDALLVEFCPVATIRPDPNTPVEPTFIPQPGLTATLAVDNDDIHTFSNLGNTGAAVAGAGTTESTFGSFMTFDIGPVGTIYDDSLPVATTVGTVPVTRRFVSGRTSGNNEVELSYDLEPTCEGDIETATDSCSCETTRFTWKFVGLD